MDSLNLTIRRANDRQWQHHAHVLEIYDCKMYPTIINLSIVNGQIAQPCLLLEKRKSLCPNDGHSPELPSQPSRYYNIHLCVFPLGIMCIFITSFYQKVHGCLEVQCIHTWSILPLSLQLCC